METRPRLDRRPPRSMSRRSLLQLVAYSAIGTVAAACARELPGWTYAPAPSATPGPSAPSAAPTGSAPTPSAPPSSAPAAGVVIRISAQNILFDLSEFSVPADTPFQIVFENLDAGVPHNVAIYEGQAGGPTLFKGEIFNGIETRTYDVPGLPAGDHYFQCDVHPSMNGTVKVG